MTSTFSFFFLPTFSRGDVRQESRASRRQRLGHGGGEVAGEEAAHRSGRAQGDAAEGEGREKGERRC